MKPKMTALKLEVILAFSFGVVFLSIMLVFAVFFANPTAFQIRVFVTTLSLAAAGVGAVIPGLFVIKYMNIARASGATAFALIVFFFQPTLEQHVASFVEPTANPEDIAATFLSHVDEGAVPAAWKMMSEEARRHVGNKEEKFQELYDNQRKPLGDVAQRGLAGMARAESPSGMAPGLYRFITYNTKFANDKGAVRPELISLRATPDLKWSVYGYNISQFVAPAN